MTSKNISDFYLPFPIREVPKEQQALYDTVKAEVDERATRLAEKQWNLPKGGYKHGMCHLVWYHKKHIFKEEYGIEWNSPADMEPYTFFD